MDSNSALPNSDTIRMQEKIAHLERNVAELNSIIYHQQKQIDRLSKMGDWLTIKVKSIQEESIDSMRDEKPPHY